MKKRKVVLIVMDGWGEAPAGKSNAVSQARTPFIDSLYRDCPHARLLTSGDHVGLPEGQMGNSEVGHLNIGAGRVVYQELALINKAIREHTIDENPVLSETFRYCKDEKKDLHLMGLVSDGGVHSHQDHLVRLCELAAAQGLKNIFIHAFTDGRDTDPKSGLGFLEYVEQQIRPTGARVASVVGRYFAMDRDKRWERIKVAYDLLVSGTGTPFENTANALQASYASGITDEFVKPVCITSRGKPLACIKPDDAVICFNFRTDRCREITTVLTQAEMPASGMKCIPLYFVTMTRYDQSFKKVQVVYEKDNLSDTLGEVVSNAGLKQIRIAETEKYPHVTFFFSGGREEAFPGEKRIMIPSPKVATYDLQPSMSAFAVRDALVAELHKGEVDFVCLNFANADMVGHTGVFRAAVEAIETVDACVADVVKAGIDNGYAYLITADHGNADLMINDDGSANTAHTTNPVPCFYVDKANHGIKLSDGILADLAPTILKIMGLEIPQAMSGKVLLHDQVPAL